MRERVLGIHLEGLSQLLRRLVLLVAVMKEKAHVRLDRDGEGIELVRPLDLGACFWEAPGRRQGIGVPVVGRRIIRIQLDGSLELSFGSGPVPVEIELHVGEGGVRLGERGIQLEGLLGGLRALGKTSLGARRLA